MAVKVKVKSFATTRKTDVTMVAEGKSPTKKVKEYPTIQLNSKQIGGLSGLSMDAVCAGTLRLKVKEIREPESYERERNGLEEGDHMVTFKVISGDITILPEVKKRGKE